MLKEFKEFAMRGNVVDMAVGIIIGAAFGKIVSSVVDDVIMPPFGLLLGKVNFANLYLNLSSTTYATLDEAMRAGAPVIRYGDLFGLRAIRNTVKGYNEKMERMRATDVWLDR